VIKTDADHVREEAARRGWSGPTFTATGATRFDRTLAGGPHRVLLFDFSAAGKVTGGRYCYLADVEKDGETYQVLRQLRKFVWRDREKLTTAWDWLT
jgi:hypothetical protein